MSGGSTTRWAGFCGGGCDEPRTILYCATRADELESPGFADGSSTYVRNHRWFTRAHVVTTATTTSCRPCSCADRRRNGSPMTRTGDVVKNCENLPSFRREKTNETHVSRILKRFTQFLTHPRRLSCTKTPFIHKASLLHIPNKYVQLHEEVLRKISIRFQLSIHSNLT